MLINHFEITTTSRLVMSRIYPHVIYIYLIVLYVNIMNSITTDQVKLFIKINKSSKS